MSELRRLTGRGRALARRLLGLPPRTYWEGRKDFRYFAEVTRMARAYAAAAETVLDVGPHQTTFVTQLSWIRHKTAIDLHNRPKMRGVQGIRGDFMEFEPPQRFDLVICLQVMEHLVEPAPFARKLLRDGHRVIVSVPYRWPKGQCKYHPQDPVDEDKIKAWMGRDWLEHAIVEDAGMRRMVAVYES